jgi:hypothetical protein
MPPVPGWWPVSGPSEMPSCVTGRWWNRSPRYLLVQRELQAARVSLLTALARQSIERAVLEQETGITGLDSVQPAVVAPVRR